MKASNIPETQQSTTGSEQCEGDTDHFFLEYQDVVHYEYAPLGQTVNKEYYQEVFCHLHDAIWRNRPELC
jgi:hypothetical protein